MLMREKWSSEDLESKLLEWHGEFLAELAVT